MIKEMTPENIEMSPDKESSQWSGDFVKVTLMGSLVDALLGIVKLWVGIVGHSTALIADGLHSFSDFATDLLVLWMGKIAYSQADANHPYGHRRFETLGSMILGASLILVAGMISWEGAVQLYQQWVLGEEKTLPSQAVLWIALLSVIAKEGIYRITTKIAEKNNSSLLAANAWHSRSDAISSLLLLVGVSVAYFGFAWVDSLLALLIGLYIAYIGGNIALKSVGELVDHRGLDERETERAKEIIEAVPGILGIHELRSRSMGPDILLDLHLDVPQEITVSEGHFLGERVEQLIRQEFKQVKEVIFHIDPHGVPHGLAQLPSREEISERLKLLKCDGLPEDKLGFFRLPGNVQLHYQKEGVKVDLYYDLLKSVEKLNLIKTDGKASMEVERSNSLTCFLQEWHQAQEVWTEAILKDKQYYIHSVTYHLQF